jgi:uncharacterized protein YdaU (DUF1376 family)
MAKKFDKQWYPFYHDLFNRSTAGWAAERVGAYILLLNHQWQNDGIPTDKDELLFIAKCTPETLDKILLKFSQEKNGKLYNKKMEIVRKEQIDKYEKRANAGKAGGTAKYQNFSNAKAMLQQNASKSLPLKNKNKSIINNTDSVGKNGTDVPATSPKIVKPKTERKVFVKPEWKEVANYMFEHLKSKGQTWTKEKLQAEAEKFINHYTGNGWKVGKNPMADWKAATRNWVLNAGQFETYSGPATQSLTTQPLGRAERAERNARG